MPVGELLTRISAAELTEWVAFERIEGPIGSRRGDLQAAIVAATVANANRGKGSKPASPSDFMPDWGRQRGTSMARWAQAVNAAHEQNRGGG